MNTFEREISGKKPHLQKIGPLIKSVVYMCVLLIETHASILLRTLILRMVDAYEIRINVRVYERKLHEIENNLYCPRLKTI